MACQLPSIIHQPERRQSTVVSLSISVEADPLCMPNAEDLVLGVPAAPSVFRKDTGNIHRVTDISMEMTKGRSLAGVVTQVGL